MKPSARFSISAIPALLLAVALLSGCGKQAQ